MALCGAVETRQACPRAWPISYIIFTTLHNTSGTSNVAVWEASSASLRYLVSLAQGKGLFLRFDKDKDWKQILCRC